MHSTCDVSREEYGMRRLLVVLIATTVLGKGSVSSTVEIRLDYLNLNQIELL